MPKTLAPLQPPTIELERAAAEAEVAEALAPLNARQKSFVLVRVANPEAPLFQCAIAAGYASKGAPAQATYLIKHPKVSRAIDLLNKCVALQVVENTGIDRTWVLNQAELVFLGALEGDDIYDKEGNWTGKKVDRRAALQALKLIGDHVDIGAFLKRHDITSKGEALEGDKTVYVIRVGDQDVRFE